MTPGCFRHAPTEESTMKPDDLEHAVRSHVESHYPIIFLVTFEEEDVDRMIGRHLG